VPVDVGGVCMYDAPTIWEWIKNCFVMHFGSSENWSDDFFDDLDKEKAEKHMKPKVDDMCDL